MTLTDMVTFGGSDLDRANDLRRDDAARAALAMQGGARWLALWRGLVLVSGPADRPALVRLPRLHPVLEAQRGLELFLGREGDDGIWVEDISAWEPDAADLAATGAPFDPMAQHHPALPADHRFVELRQVMAALSPRDAELAATSRAILAWHDSHGFCAKCGERSAPAQGGWQRNCTACAAPHFPRTDPVVIMVITKGNDILLGRSRGWAAGMYSLLAGFIEPGETVEAAVRREVFEETGIRVGDVGYLASQPWPFPASLMLGCKGQATSTAITIDPDEIEDALWCTREDLALAFAGAHPVISPPRPGSIARFLMEQWLADRLG